MTLFLFCLALITACILADIVLCTFPQSLLSLTSKYFVVVPKDVILSDLSSNPLNLNNNYILALVVLL